MGEPVSRSFLTNVGVPPHSNACQVACHLNLVGLKGWFELTLRVIPLYSASNPKREACSGEEGAVRRAGWLGDRASHFLVSGVCFILLFTLSKGPISSFQCCQRGTVCIFEDRETNPTKMGEKLEGTAQTGTGIKACVILHSWAPFTQRWPPHSALLPSQTETLPCVPQAHCSPWMKSLMSSQTAVIGVSALHFEPRTGTLLHGCRSSFGVGAVCIDCTKCVYNCECGGPGFSTLTPATSPSAFPCPRPLVYFVPLLLVIFSLQICLPSHALCFTLKKQQNIFQRPQKYLS